MLLLRRWRRTNGQCGLCKSRYPVCGAQKYHAEPTLSGNIYRKNQCSVFSSIVLLEVSLDDFVCSKLGYARKVSPGLHSGFPSLSINGRGERTAICGKIMNIILRLALFIIIIIFLSACDKICLRIFYSCEMIGTVVRKAPP